MFSEKSIRYIANKNKTGLLHLKEVESAMQSRFYQSDLQIRGLILAVATGEPLIFIGPPGTAKSNMVRALCQLMGVYDETKVQGDGRYFEYLLSPFTEPSELFGFYDLAKLYGKHVLERNEENTMQKSTVTFLDEVFNGSSALMNSLLAVINEGILHDRGKVLPVDMKCLFSATNHVPNTPELLAFYDRFLFRVRVDNVGTEFSNPSEPGRPLSELPTALQDLIGVAWKETYKPRGIKSSAVIKDKRGCDLLKSMDALRQDIREAVNGKMMPNSKPDDFTKYLAEVVDFARKSGISKVSNRRLIKMTHAMFIHRVYRCAAFNETTGGFGKPEFDLIWKYFLDRDDAAPIEKIKGMWS